MSYLERKAGEDCLQVSEGETVVLSENPHQRKGPRYPQNHGYRLLGPSHRSGATDGTRPDQATTKTSSHPRQAAESVPCPEFSSKAPEEAGFEEDQGALNTTLPPTSSCCSGRKNHRADHAPSSSMTQESGLEVVKIRSEAYL